MTLKIAILGANGFVGSRAVEMLYLSQLAQVIPVVRSFTGLARLSRFNLDYRIADAFDQDAMTKAFSGCEVVVHAVAGDPSVILGTIAPAYHAAQQAGVRRLVYLSSGSVHGQAPAPGTTEASPLNSQQPISYNNAKVQAELKLKQLRTRGNVEIVILRPGIVVGPRSFWIADFAERLLDGTAYLVDQGQAICNSIYVDNLIQAIYLAATTTGIDGEAFLVGDNETVTWADLYKPVARALGFDLTCVPEATLPEAETQTMLDRLDLVRASKPAQAFLSLFPMKLRQAAFFALAALREEQPPSPWTTSDLGQPEASLEMALLYQCQYKLPHVKATQLLRYEPAIPFTEACRRTAAWLSFAGYPVCQPSMEIKEILGMSL